MWYRLWMSIIFHDFINILIQFYSLENIVHSSDDSEDQWELRTITRVRGTRSGSEQILKPISVDAVSRIFSRSFLEAIWILSRDWMYIVFTLYLKNDDNTVKVPSVFFFIIFLNSWIQLVFCELREMNLVVSRCWASHYYLCIGQSLLDDDKHGQHLSRNSLKEESKI